MFADAGKVFLVPVFHTCPVEGIETYGVKCALVQTYVILPMQEVVVVVFADRLGFRCRCIVVVCVVVDVVRVFVVDVVCVFVVVIGFCVIFVVNVGVVKSDIAGYITIYVFIGAVFDRILF